MDGSLPILLFGPRGITRNLFALGATTIAALATFSFTIGCRGYQYGHLIKNDQPDLVGSHTAGSEVFNPLIDESVAKLLSTAEVASQHNLISPMAHPCSAASALSALKNKSAEELGDFKDQIYQQIDTQINRSQAFRAISRRMVDAGLQETRLRPDSLLVPDNMRLFCSVLQRDGQPVDYLLYATLTSGTTERNKSSQRDYLLTLELIDTHTGLTPRSKRRFAKAITPRILARRSITTHSRLGNNCRAQCRGPSAVCLFALAIESLRTADVPRMLIACSNPDSSSIPISSIKPTSSSINLLRKNGAAITR